MSDFKGIMKNGWHPKGKDGGKESWRGDFKGVNQVAGWMGKGKTSESAAAREHVSRPLASLKDPSSFGPPPKNVNYHGGAALPNEITPDRGGWGAPLSDTQISRANASVPSSQPEEAEESAKPPPPSLPYRADRTGLRTDNLPPPPVHRNVQQSRIESPPVQPQSAPTQPKVPPRLPSRQNTLSPTVNEPPPPSYDAVVTKPTPNPYINQSAVNRLGNSGVSVPAFGIGGQAEANPWSNENSQTSSTGNNQLSELQARFSKMSSQSSNTVNAPADQSQTSNQTSMPSWKQSQSAFNTAQNLRTNPQNVTLADAQSAAQTAGQAQRSAGAFREKHADQIAAAQTKAKAWDQKYKFTSKINKFLDEHTDADNQQQAQQQQPNPQAGQASQQPHSQFAQVSQQQYQTHNPAITTYNAQPPPQQPPTPVQQPSLSPVSTDLSASIARKPPPPPAPRKPAKLQAPPPVPMGTKPSFS